MVTVDLNIPVICYGLRADFSLGLPRLHPPAGAGPRHRRDENHLHLRPQGHLQLPQSERPFVFEGDQVAIDLENDVQYVSMCPQCYFKAKRAFYAEKAASRVE